MLDPRGLASHHGVATKKNLIMVDDLYIPTIIMYLIHGHVICDLTYYHVLHLIPLILYLPFALEHICFHKHNDTWHELYSTGRSVIVPFLLVSLAIGLVLCLSIGFFEVLSHLFNICGDMGRVHVDTHGHKVESTGRHGHLPNIK